MEILGGAMDVKLAGSDAWNTYAEGQAFEVEGNSKFSLKVADGGADYCCTYIQ
jgi:uncharacterized protein YaiE (UPF0345 family)